MDASLARRLDGAGSEGPLDVAALLSASHWRDREWRSFTNAGGPGILAVSACEANELSSCPQRCDPVSAAPSPAAASVNNPVEVPRPHPPGPRRALESSSPDGTSTASSPSSFPTHKSIHDGCVLHRGRCRTRPDKPVLTEALAPIQPYAFPESAALALARVTTYRPMARDTGRSGTRAETLNGAGAPVDASKRVRHGGG